MNKPLQRTLEDERTKKRGLFEYIKRTYDLSLGIADKFLIISQLRDYDDGRWDSLWKHARLVLKQFGYKEVV